MRRSEKRDSNRSFALPVTCSPSSARSATVRSPGSSSARAGLLDDDEETFLRKRKTVRKGDQGSEVAKAQMGSVLFGGRAPPEYHGVDDIGDFTLRFDALVRLFQARTKQTIDGVIGRKTWDMLFLFASLAGTSQVKGPPSAGEGAGGPAVA